MQQETDPTTNDNRKRGYKKKKQSSRDEPDTSTDDSPCSAKGDGGVWIWFDFGQGLEVEYCLNQKRLEWEQLRLLEIEGQELEGSLMLIEPAQNHGWAGMEVPLQFKRQCGDLESIIYEGKTVPNNVLEYRWYWRQRCSQASSSQCLTRRFRAKQYQKEGYKPRDMILWFFLQRPNVFKKNIVFAQCALVVKWGGEGDMGRESHDQTWSQTLWPGKSYLYHAFEVLTPQKSHGQVHLDIICYHSPTSLHLLSYHSI